MKTNVPVKSPKITTHEGAPAVRINAEQQLRRSLMSCLLWEKEFYEDGVEIASRIAQFVPEVTTMKVAAMAVEARSAMNLRHAPLWVVRQMAKTPKHKTAVADTLATVIQRADELPEFVSLYWLDGKQPLSAQVKKGLARAFQKFDEYQLAKYNREGAVTLRDVLFMCHAKPKDEAQDALWKRLIAGELASPETWENRLSRGENKREVWESMLDNSELGALALLRNLRNMYDAKVDQDKVFAAMERMNVSRVLPFRFIAAARHAPQWESQIEKAMFRSLKDAELIPGTTILLVDVSGSMDWRLGDKSEMIREDAADGLAILAREICEQGAIFSFSNQVVRIPDRHGFALRDAIRNSQQHSGTYLGKAVEVINKNMEYDRLIVITDEQSHDSVPAPKSKGYVINVASNRNGVGYGAWTHIDGWSEAVLRYIQEIEKVPLTNIEGV